MLNIAKCKQLLHNEENFKNYDDAEVALIRDYLYSIAKIQVEIENNTLKKQRP